MAKKTSIEEVAEMVAHVVKHMATKDDLERMATKEDLGRMATKDDLARMAEDVTRLERKFDARFDGLERRMDAEALVRMDQKLPERVARIEKHLDLKPINSLK